MALQIDRQITNALGEKSTFTAYIRLQDLTVRKNDASAVFKVLTQDQSKMVDEVFHNFEHDVASSANNIWSQAYEKLKELSEFSEAVDV